MNRHPRYWTAADEARLVALYPDTRTDAIAELLGVPISRVHTKAAALGLKKSPAFLASTQSGRMQRGTQLGAEHRFKPGVSSWNKGVHYQPGGNIERAQFKRGHRPHNVLPVGTVVVADIGYLKRKVAEPNRWEWVHRATWEAAHGPVPQGHVVAFRDGNRANTALENLELVSKAEWMRRHTYLQLPEELQQVVRARAVLSREINKQTKRGQE